MLAILGLAGINLVGADADMTSGVTQAVASAIQLDTGHQVKLLVRNT